MPPRSSDGWLVCVGGRGRGDPAALAKLFCHRPLERERGSRGRQRRVPERRLRQQQSDHRARARQGQ
jgi:hypothetical protein